MQAIVFYFCLTIHFNIHSHGVTDPIIYKTCILKIIIIVVAVVITTGISFSKHFKFKTFVYIVL